MIKLVVYCVDAYSSWPDVRKYGNEGSRWSMLYSGGWREEGRKEGKARNTVLLLIVRTNDRATSPDTGSKE